MVNDVYGLWNSSQFVYGCLSNSRKSFPNYSHQIKGLLKKVTSHIICHRLTSLLLHKCNPNRLKWYLSLFSGTYSKNFVWGPTFILVVHPCIACLRGHTTSANKRGGIHSCVCVICAGPCYGSHTISLVVLNLLVKIVCTCRTLWYQINRGTKVDRIHRHSIECEAKKKRYEMTDHKKDKKGNC